MKKLFSIMLSVLMIINLFFCSAVCAESEKLVISLQIGNRYMTVNGVQKEIDPGFGTAPVIMNGRTLMPLRAVIEELGGRVDWYESKRVVELKLGEDKVALIIDSNMATVNTSFHILEQVPVIIEGRTMLPVRFIAECFNLDISWDGQTQTVTIISAFASVGFKLADVPPYSGEPCAVINGNKPYFRADEITDVSYEYYTDLDRLGRCGVCVASLSPEIMPTDERGDIGHIKPTGWHNEKYDFVPGGYVYNRCHLIGYQLSAENDNRKNIITGTRYMNIEGMLPLENKVADYIEETGNNVMYRVTPVFEGSNLLAAGVLIEAYSVEDEGEGICFCVFCYNVQPGVHLDYASGFNTAVLQVAESVEYFCVF